MVFERILVIIRKELRQALREPRLRTMMFLPPVIQLLVFGFAVNLDVENARVAFFDQDRTPESRELLSRFEGSGQFRVVGHVTSEAEMQDALDRGRSMLVIRVMKGFSRDIQRGSTAAVQIIVDGTNSNTASIASGYAATMVQEYGRSKKGGSMRLNPEPRPRVWFNEDLRSRNYFVPGVILNIITIITLMLTAMSIVREKEIGTMEQLMVTPVRPIELMLGKMIPFSLIGLLDMVLATTVALLVFHVPFRGSALLLFLASVVFLMTTLGAGLFISTISGTQQQALMSSFFFFMPAFMLSGFAFPIRNMPEAIQWLTKVNPLVYFMDVLRGIFLKGAGIETLWPQLLTLTVFGLAVLVGSAMRFHKRLD